MCHEPPVTTNALRELFQASPGAIEAWKCSNCALPQAPEIVDLTLEDSDSDVEAVVRMVEPPAATRMDSEDVHPPQQAASTFQPYVTPTHLQTLLRIKEDEKESYLKSLFPPRVAQPDSCTSSFMSTSVVPPNALTPWIAVNRRRGGHPRPPRKLAARPLAEASTSLLTGGTQDWKNW